MVKASERSNDSVTVAQMTIAHYDNDECIYRQLPIFSLPSGRVKSQRFLTYKPLILTLKSSCQIDRSISGLGLTACDSSK
jgi:hypothetical protein